MIITKMADYEKFITGCFPSIDPEIVSYVTGMLEDSDVVASSDDMFEAIGPFFEQVDVNKTEDDIREICNRLYALIGKQDTVGEVSNGPHKILDAPVHLGALIEDKKDKTESTGSIWMSKRDSTLQVDSKQLAKAEAQIQKKQKKQADKDGVASKKPNGVLDGPTASQQFNKRDMKFDASGANRSYDIKIENFDIAFGDRVLLTGASLHLSEGRRYGLCGRNGLGKTTLLKMISSGNLQIPSHISILHVEQEVVGDDTLSLDSVLESDEERHKLLTREKELNQLLNSSEHKGENSLSTELSEIYQKLEAIEASKAPAKAAVILAGLGFSPQMQRAPTRSLSGGWRMRLALARALFSKPDLLLLDQPTNMLDMKAIIWLENYLQTWPTTILVVSHDRSFLNSVCTEIVHLHDKRLDTYKGNYDQFDKTKEERMKNQKKEYEAQKQYRDHIQVFIDRFRYNANRASQVQSKLKLLEKLPPLEPPGKESEVTIRFPECEKLSSNILQLDELQFYYSKDRIIFDNVDCNANMSSRICIVGENGAGKTTLLKILLGDLSPTKGIRHVHRSLRIGYFSQHHVDQLEMELNSIELLQQRFPGQTIEQYRGVLGQYGVSGELATRPVTSLSGGQKSRVAFAVMSMTNPNFFILDEPTNHLDMETIEALGFALKKFAGGVILVSHDERLIKMVCEELWVVRDKKVVSLEGGFPQYKQIVEEELRAQGC
ncbi:ATP-binding cassette sub-family F member 3-like [Ruditapes philippinarum]|uniref:ATP-binding cassette sub-family F member 3-like n=1 Tax=Ruditapes philippinarum TaxID=129788 RepID=UPI00295A9D00|nr:ATP-binding cassette sub-family F member 3-like [Ruditapes philippinarum]